MKAMKKILTALLAVSMALALVSAAAAVDFDGGNGTFGSPYKIRTAEQLLEFASRVGNSETTLCAVLTANITVNDWEIIAGTERTYSNYSLTGGGPYTDSANPYAGTFAGNSHKLTLSRTLAGTAQSACGIALFHTIGTQGIVKNLNLDVNFQGLSSLAGVALRNFGTIEYVTVEGTIKYGNVHAYAAGIAEYNGCKTIEGTVVPGKILHCVNKATLDTDVTYTAGNLSGKKRGGYKLAGICADFLGEMRYCVNLSDIWVTSAL